MKLSYYHKHQGHQVGFKITNPDKIYVSCIFQKNKNQVLGLKSLYPDTEIVFGGSGINFEELPANIEKGYPDYYLYPSIYSQGYTTRGCIRNCPWCIVHGKEGKFRRQQKVKDFHDEQFDTVMIMDNNWLADKDFFFKNTDYILENRLKVIEHGMDIRLLDKEIAQRLNELRFAKPMKFAFDNMVNEPGVIDGINLLKSMGVDIKHHVMFYVLVGFNTTFKEDVYRCELLKKLGTNSYVMPYRKNKDITRLARWSNNKWFYWSVDFDSFCKGYKSH